MADNKTFMKSLQAYEKIRDMILTGVKLPGTRLVLSELEAELGIGRGPIREALMRLDRSGLVKNIPYKGAIVATPPTQKEILHIYDLRADLEAKLAVEAIDKLTDSDILKLEELHRTHGGTSPEPLPVGPAISPCHLRCIQIFPIFATLPRHWSSRWKAC